MDEKIWRVKRSGTGEMRTTSKSDTLRAKFFEHFAPTAIELRLRGENNLRIWKYLNRYTDFNLDRSYCSLLLRELFLETDRNE